MTQEICKRLILDCIFVNDKVTVKVLIDLNSIHNSISKALVQKIGLYITREFGSEYPIVKELDIGVTNTDKKVMVRGWVSRKEVSVSLPNIFDGLKSLPLVIIDTKTFVVVDKLEYDLVLGNNWLIWMGKKIDKRNARY